MHWDDLLRELSLWKEAGATARFWWRDDDAVDASPALDTLLDLAATHAVEVGLAVIPMPATEGLAEALARRTHVVALQHGYRHSNHARAGLPAVECGGARPVEETLDELGRGFRRMAGLFGERFAPVLAAPWNNIDEDIALRLDACGFVGLSAFGPRAKQPRAPGVVVANAHVDPLNWRAGGRFAGTEKALSGIAGELRWRRTGATEADEPLGILTHHLNHDAETWAFLERLFRVTSAEGAEWLCIEAVFAHAPAAAPA